ncbi:putative hydro-lyase [Staphylococcus sp. ACRSN]|uniref:putative hydro-lyase n=1 Tax=Staphylococcus sp. ACRSN TaxID=2918214 RepID=UPI001EF35876|nr:putative hydro-lyase [Staphylococcus sp. ACRSN]MCG7339034.1 putative hydro-lyase [Staphylococcus sp. ACRSN]
MDLNNTKPNILRKMISNNELIQNTSGMAKGYVQANVVILPSKYAYDFLKFCFRNPKTCPLLDISERGNTTFPIYGNNADIRSEVGKYRVYEYGQLVDEPKNISHIFNDDMVSFLIGCSFTFEHALLEAGIPIRHIEENHNVPMFVTNIAAHSSGQFSGNITVSMRPMTMTQAIQATEITSHYTAVHGTPIHIGSPNTIGIQNITQPDFGEPVTIKDGEVPVFWGCGVTPQSVALKTRPELMITHSPGHMFITDVLDNQLKN